MEKKILRMMATGLVGCMLAVTATGCGNSGTSSTPATSDTSASNTTNESASSDSSTAKDESSSQDIVSLKWIQIGNGQPVMKTRYKLRTSCIFMFCLTFLTTMYISNSAYLSHIL